MNAASAVSGANYFWNHTLSDLHYWGAAAVSSIPILSTLLNLRLAHDVAAVTAPATSEIPRAGLPVPFRRQ